MEKMKRTEQRQKEFYGAAGDVLAWSGGENPAY
jgi:hypothetical protein